jgi:ribosomal protein S18 acetylase RimI-like enzyme
LLSYNDSSGCLATVMTTSPRIRPINDADHAAVSALLEPIVRAGDVFALPRAWSRDDIARYWLAPDHVAFIAEVDGALAGTYYLHANQLGGGGHVANCGYATRIDATGRGVARAMCAHSLDEARRRGFRAMQFNFVVASNERAVRLWTDMGFATVGRLPGAFEHPTRGYVDALVMYRAL